MRYSAIRAWSRTLCKGLAFRQRKKMHLYREVSPDRRRLSLPFVNTKQVTVTQQQLCTRNLYLNVRILLMYLMRRLKLQWRKTGNVSSKLLKVCYTSDAKVLRYKDTWSLNRIFINYWIYEPPMSRNCGSGWASLTVQMYTIRMIYKTKFWCCLRTLLCGMLSWISRRTCVHGMPWLLMNTRIFLTRNSYRSFSLGE